MTQSIFMFLNYSLLKSLTILLSKREIGFLVRGAQALADWASGQWYHCRSDTNFPLHLFPQCPVPTYQPSMLISEGFGSPKWSYLFFFKAHTKRPAMWRVQPHAKMRSWNVPLFLSHLPFCLISLSSDIPTRRRNRESEVVLGLQGT